MKGLTLRTLQHIYLQVALTRTHFKFGEEEMDYTTDHQMGFQYDPEKVNKSSSPL